MKPFELHIGLTQSTQSPPPGTRSFKDIRGGPVALLRWLEDQLALMRPDPDAITRVIDYLDLLETAGGSAYRNSLDTDAWPTARYLLERRDELVLCGWDLQAREDLPDLVNDLAEAESHGDVPPGLPDRLVSVQQALENGRDLPDHTCHLMESPDQWPARWQSVLDHLNVRERDITAPATNPDGTLHRVRHGLAAGDTPEDLPPDNTFGVLHAHSNQRACSAVASLLCNDGPHDPDNTVIVCADANRSALLERTLAASGLPHTGSAAFTRQQPALQVLPLAMDLLWKPVDPRTVLDLLTLPVAPFPDYVCGLLTDALADMPGLNSQAWNDARKKCLEIADDPEHLDERLSNWFDVERRATGEPVPHERIAEQCNTVVNWAQGRASVLDEEEHPRRRAAFQSAAAMAATLKELSGRNGTELRKPQLDRIIEDLQEHRSGSAQYDATGPGPIVVGSLGDVPPDCQHLIWLGTSMEEEPLRYWTNEQREKLRANDIDVSYLDRRADLRRQQERRGFLQTTGSLTVVQFTGEVEKPDHPLWIRVRDMLRDDLLERTNTTIDAYIKGNAPPAPFHLPSRTVDHEDPQPERPLWDVSNDRLTEPDTSSATELTERLACPARWMFKRVARIRSSTAATLPRLFRLKGRFAHQLFDRVFNTDGERPEPDAAAERMRTCFEERIERDAAPLSLPERYDDRQDLNDELAAAARSFVNILNRGDYTVDEIETPINAEIDGRNMRGFIDCLVNGENGNEGVIDFKYAGINKYREKLAENRAVQLAVYCRARANEAGSDASIEGTGYYVLNGPRLYTPEDRPLRGARSAEIVEGAEDLFTVWNRFSAALDEGNDWFDGDAPVPARPLQDDTDWPDGADLVIDTDAGKERDELAPCTYCDYSMLCGVRTCE